MEQSNTLRTNLKLARSLWGNLDKRAFHGLKELAEHYGFAIAAGDIISLQGRWYVTHTGLIRLARPFA